MSWQIDPAHTRVAFAGRHMMIAKVRGSFEKLNCTVNFDENDPTKSTVDREVTLDVKYEGQSKSPWGTTAISLSAAATINRKD
jgi:polyisoprenoid-binding protein YceI